MKGKTVRARYETKITIEDDWKGHLGADEINKIIEKALESRGLKIPDIETKMLKVIEVKKDMFQYVEVE